MDSANNSRKQVLSKINQWMIEYKLNFNWNINNWYKLKSQSKQRNGKNPKHNANKNKNEQK